MGHELAVGTVDLRRCPRVVQYKTVFVICKEGQGVSGNYRDNSGYTDNTEVSKLAVPFWSVELLFFFSSVI